MGEDPIPRLPAEEFSYIGRPAETFEGRWKAIETALTERFGLKGAFSLVDVGSNHGYFSLNTALRYPNSFVLGIEGAVGVGNGTIGTCTRDAGRLVATSAIRTHLTWLEKLGLKNCLVAPEVWDIDSIEQLRAKGCRADVMLTLSVIHHIDGICEDIYAKRGLSKVDGTLELMAQLLALADVHVIELPGPNWVHHMHKQFVTYEKMLTAAIARHGGMWKMHRIYQNDWFGMRELWVVEKERRPEASGSPEDLRNFFPILMPGADIVIPTSPEADPSLSAFDTSVELGFENGGEPIDGDAAFARRILAGTWRSAYGATIEVSGEPPRLQCLYSSNNDMRSIEWANRSWSLETPAGHFTLVSASTGRLAWRERSNNWTTVWQRA